MTEMDELSLAIGGLQQAEKSASSQRAVIFEKLDDVVTAQHELRGMHRELLRYQDEQSKTLKTLGTDIEDYKKLKNRGIGVITFIGFMSAGGGAILGKFFPG